MTKKTVDTKAHDALFEAILSLENLDQCRAFFEDICTIKEMQDLSQRFRVAQMLSEGKNYQEICAATGASTATICRVNKCLTWGEGYRIVLDKTEQSAQGD